MIRSVTQCIDSRPEVRPCRKAGRIFLRCLSPDAPGLWMQPAGLREMNRRLFAETLAQEVLGQTEMNMAECHRRIRQMHPGARCGLVVGELTRRTLEHPVAHGANV